MPRVQESGMPEKEYWESLFQIDLILEAMHINHTIRNAAEIGFGYGTFSIPVAKKISGTLYAYDLEESLLDLLEERKKEEFVLNIKPVIRDVLEMGTGMKSSCLDYLLLFNIVHNEEPEIFYKEANRILQDGGICGVIHWRSDIETPRGPSPDIRPKPEKIISDLRKNGFSVADKEILLDPYHFGVLGYKIPEDLGC